MTKNEVIQGLQKRMGNTTSETQALIMLNFLCENIDWFWQEQNYDVIPQAVWDAGMEHVRLMSADAVPLKSPDCDADIGIAIRQAIKLLEDRRGN